MQELSKQQKQEALDALLKKYRDESIPMESAPMDEMSPEKAAELDSVRNPASKPESEMEAAPIDEFMPKGSFVGDKLGQQVSPDVAEPVMDEKAARLAKIKALFQNR